MRPHQKLNRSASVSGRKRLPVIVAGLALMIAATLCGLPGCSAPPPPAPSAPVSNGSASVKEVTFKTTDDWNIIGDLYTPSVNSKGAVILLHQRGGSGRDWTPFCLALQKAGFTALAIDQRGAGRSIKGPGPLGDDAPWPTSPDIAAAILYLKSRGPIGLAGASYGANNALIYAAAHPDEVKGVALFSPGADYNGLDALAPAKSWHGPLILFHDNGDTVAGDGPKQIEQASASTSLKLNVSQGSRHGTALLPDTAEYAVAFFKRSLE